MGGLAATGVLNQLGRPDMERAEVLAREALQNCWDAKLPSASAVRADIGRVVLDAGGSAALRELLVDPPPLGLPLRQVLSSERDVLLYFADFGTSGLGGPVRADLAGEPRDYIDFVLNVGQPPDKQMGGGSFGYGKAAFYLASRARTVIIDTVCQYGGRLERRLVACALGSNYTDGQGRTFTGRHWWGQQLDGGPAPVTGEVADDLARRLGLPHRGLTDTGTTIAIVAPDIRPADESHPDGATGLDADRTMRFLADSIVWNFWPRMVSTPGSQTSSLDVVVTNERRNVPLIDPRTHPQLRGFVDALDGLRLESLDDDPMLVDRPIERLRPYKRLGRLVIARGPSAPVPSASDMPLTRGARELQSGVHHVALLRTPEIVVKYLRCEQPAHAGASYSGVFRCHVDVDDAFKEAEPPTHDDWVYSNMGSSTHKSIVRMALDRIRTAAREAAGQGGAIGTQAGTDVPLGELSDALARLFPGLGGVGGRHPAQSVRPRGGERIKKPGGQRAGDDASPILPSARAPHLTLDGSGAPLLAFPFTVRSDPRSWEVTAAVEVMNRDGDKAENDPPAGELAPGVHSWVSPSGSVHLGPRLRLEPGPGGDWLARVHRTGEFVVRLDVKADEVGGSRRED